MRAPIQRVDRAAVHVGGEAVGEIGRGLVIFLGVRSGDREDDARLLAKKIAHLRIFPDGAGKLNRSLLDIGGEALSVSF
ncbi:MAG TPA: D-aminoacyl-tRNA deacylase, partial [Methylomirabilota bacterium]|nr:D-aminoacyl-tRNA deacylase [Methylomirabilota bacterium]